MVHPVVGWTAPKYERRKAFENEVVLVTGGSRGIGSSIVAGVAAGGGRVGFTYVSDHAAAGRVMADAAAEGGTAKGFQSDVANARDVASLIDHIERDLGTLTMVVNNAGVTGPIAPFIEADHAVIRRVMDVNVLGTMYVPQEVARRWLLRRCRGTIVNISSAASTLGAAHEYVHYAASKAAIDAFTLGVARELAASGIRVNAVAPGTTMTDIHAAAGQPDRARKAASHIPLGRSAVPNEIAEAVLWLLSPAASYVTGSVLRVSGGL